MKKYISVFNCEVCKKGYNKPLSHISCYKKFCLICKKCFTTETIKNKHCFDEHSNKYCKICNCITDQLIEHLKSHHNIDY